MQMEFDSLQSLQTSIYWLKAVILQGKRSIDAQTEPHKHTNSALYNTTARLEEYSFLNVCRKAHRWLNGLSLVTPEAARFVSFEKSIKEVRDNREHDEERYGVKGHRKEPMRKAKSTMTKLTLSSSVSVRADGRLLLGGTVDVEVVVKAAESLLDSLLLEQHEHWNKKIDDVKVAESYHIEPRFRSH